VGIVSAMRMFGGGLHGYGFTVFFLLPGRVPIVELRRR
jgi:hypothetical protein